MIKKWISRTPLYRPACWLLERWLEWKELLDWRKAGRPPPPPHRVKQRILKKYARRYGLTTLLETGTYKGDMVEAMRKHFDQIYSIELSPELCEEANRRFAGFSHIHLLCGNSALELPRILENTDLTQQSVLFWLDGHYSAGVTAKADKETPICEELLAIFNVLQQRAVILIDDARCFGKAPDYPDLETLKTLVHQHRPSASFDVETDIIRIVVA